MVKIALDGFGGDNAPYSVVRGACDALLASAKGSIYLYITGVESELREVIERVTLEVPEFSKYSDCYEIVNATEKIEMAENPIQAISKKKDSSLVVAMKLVKNKTAQAFVSGGSTGAILVGGQAIIGRQKGVLRSPLAPLVPTIKGTCLLIDCGANVDAKPEWLVQYAHMGSIYMQNAMGIKNPKVGLLSIGTEEEKGNTLTKAVFPLLKEAKEINFIGNIEGRDVNSGICDVVVCDAFSGNVCLKTLEGAANAILSSIKSALKSTVKTKIGALLIKKALKKKLSSFDTSNYGGAPMLGLKGLVVKCHGSSKPKEIKNSILQCQTFYEQDINTKIAERIGEFDSNGNNA